MTGEPLAGVHLRGPDTEGRAAASIAAHLPRLQATVLGILRDNPAGLTDDEGAAIMGVHRLDFGRRRHELADAGLVISTGDRRVTPRGRYALVWRAK